MVNSDRRFGEWWLVAAVIGLTLVFLLAPVAVGLMQNSPTHYWFGANQVTIADYPVYLSFIEQAREGKLIFTNLYTTEPQTPALFMPLWLALGVFSQLVGGGAILWFYLAKIAAAAGLLLMLYAFIRRLFPEIWQRLTTLVFLAWSSGLGFLIVPAERVWKEYVIFYKVSADFWIPESNTFLSMYHSPLFSMAQLLLLAIFYVFLFVDRQWKFLLLTLLTLLLGILHPYDLVTVGLVLFLYVLVRWLTDRRFSWTAAQAYIAVVAGALPAGLYYVWITRSEWVVSAWALRNWTPSPPVFSYLFGYGLVLMLAVIGAAVVLRRYKKDLYFLLVWALTSGVLLYAPSPIQRRFANGLHIALALLAALALILIIQRLQKQRAALYIILPFLFAGLLVSNITILVEDVASYQRHQFPAVWPSEYASAADWLQNNSAPDDAVMADVQIANVLPALTGRPVYAGHGHQTADFDKKRKLLERWFFRTNTDDAGKAALLRANHIRFVWYSEYERVWGDFAPSEKDYLEKVYERGGVEVYQVKE
ncbi:hypothetical protein HY933_02815 [Candidatus Falkowbacteria bacterium]|nr:hypothetical protein [Candidatus Falkowbacteria bacterium]